MIQVKTLNSISPVYSSILSEARYNVAPDAENPEAILVRSADMHSYKVNPELLCVARAGAGVNNLPLDEFAQQGIVAFNSPGANANAVKELVIAGLFLASRKISDGIAWCNGLADGETTVEKQVESGKKMFVGPEIEGKTLGVIGLGAIGVLVANTASSLGMKVLGYDPYISVDNAWKLSRSVQHVTDIDEIFRNSDYITVHVPLMDSTRDTINAHSIELMKNNVAILNFARDGLVNLDAVLQGLDSGKVRVYMTDFPTARLIGKKGVILTPHLGASTPESEDNCVRMVAKQIDAYLRNGSILNSVNYPNCKLCRVSSPRICILHQNVPNVIGTVTKIIGEANLNIDNMVNVSRKAVAYTVLDVDGTPTKELTDMLSSLDTVYRVRVLMPEA